jgi:predicted translin family RNA/ssDNA-binding protein
MEQKYVKDKKTGVVINVSGEYSEWLRAKSRFKDMNKTNQELKTAKNEMSSLKNEIAEMKDMIAQLLSKKA